jgi:uncharacterized protein (TIGR00661 family)
MRILYGVVGEGMGHAMRSRVVIDALSREHDVHVVVSGRAHDYFERRAGAHLQVSKIWGYTLVYEDNEVQKFKTVFENLKGAVSGGWPRNVRAYFDVAEKFKPDVVISDFETWSYFFGKVFGVPVISIDNMQIIDRCEHAPEILEGLGAEFALTKAIVKAKVAGAKHYFITTFFYPPTRKQHTTLVPPILRPEILSARRGAEGHLLVYQSSTSNQALAGVLEQSGLECRIYGMRRDIEEEERDGNLRYRPFSEPGFIEDLATARGVIASAGFTLMGEAVYLQRPMLAVPLGKQIEQVINARYLAREGYGMAADEVTRESLGAFVEQIPAFENKLAAYAQRGNEDLLLGLAEKLSELTSR